MKRQQIEDSGKIEKSGRILIKLGDLFTFFLLIRKVEKFNARWGF
ncbi:hypothetical protein J2Z40_003517 [Cytobacillus eiseniae]|uniref:Uncharacterized protein n=1 Tax=Cytobacillus eiseniae TaxID=762947 RepID=A0ABS4RJ49_9BACI|nr:hypothetical protein [Cytobacillus eiseniae]